ncbi:MAG: AsmA family protein [Proteobacteria bacterium]|nr:AsmA family protein [Pseudomonadota bacterium]
MAARRRKGSRIAKALKIVAVALVAVVVAAIAILYSLDVSEYKRFVEERVADATGRRLEIAGEVRLRLGLAPALAVEGVTLANAPWGSEPAMLRLDRLEGEVSLLSLLTGEVRIARLVLSGADVLLETDAGGRGNWELGRPPAPAAGAAKADARAPFVPGFGEVLIEDVRLRFRDGATGRTQTFGLERLTARVDDLARPLRITARGDAAGRSVEAEAELGPLARLLGEGTGPYPVRLALAAGGMSARIEGALAEPLKAKGLDLAVEAEGTEFADLAALAGARIGPAGPFRLAARVKDAAGGYEVSGLAAKVGESEIKGRASLALGGRRPRLNARIEAERLVLDPFLGASGEVGAGAGARAPAKAGRVFPGDPLPLRALGAADGALSLAARTIRLGALAAEDVAAEAKLEAGVLRLDPLKLRLAGGVVGGRALVDSRADPPRIETRIEAERLDLARLLAATPAGDLVAARLDAKADLKGRGASLRAIAASLEGATTAVMGEGKLASRYAEYVAADLLGALLPGGAKGEATITCAVSRFEVANGIATSKALLFDTGRITIGGGGTVNLGDESLDLTLVPRPKNPSLVSLATPVRVRGTLASPVFVPDTAALATGVAKLVLGGAVNPLGVLLPFVSPGTGDKNPCVAALEAAGRRPATPPAAPARPASPVPPAATPEAEQKPGGLGGFLQGLGGALDRALGEEKPQR